MLMPTYLFENEFTQFSDIISKYSCSELHFKKDSVIINHGETRNYSYFIIKGLVSFSIIKENGKNKISTFRGEGTIFPLYYSYKVTSMEKIMEVKAYTDVTVLKINREDLYDIMLRYPSFAVRMSDIYCKYANLLLFDINSKTFDKAFVMLSNFLYIYITHMTINKIIPLTIDEIFEITGLPKSDISQCIEELKIRGIVSINDENQLLVIDSDKLHDISFVTTLEEGIV
jgi:CRP-like cAMP-binding protein